MSVSNSMNSPRVSGRQPAAIRIRRATVKDARAIRALETLVWGHEVTNRYDMPMFVRHGWTFIAQTGGRVVAAIVAFATREGRVWVSDWVVHPAHRHRHLGLALYRYLFNATKGRTVESFVDARNAVSVQAHHVLGFRAVRKVKGAYGAECHSLDFGPHVLFRRSPR